MSRIPSWDKFSTRSVSSGFWKDFLVLLGSFLLATNNSFLELCSCIQSQTKRDDTDFTADQFISIDQQKEMNCTLSYLIAVPHLNSSYDAILPLQYEYSLVKWHASKKRKSSYLGLNHLIKSHLKLKHWNCNFSFLFQYVSFRVWPCLATDGTTRTVTEQSLKPQWNGPWPSTIY